MSDTVTANWPAISRIPRTPLKARIAKAILRPAVDRAPVRVSFPTGESWGSGSPDDPEMHIVRPAAFFARLGSDAKIGFGESYMAGDWCTGPGTDLAELLTPFAARVTTIVPPPLQRLRRLVDERIPRTAHNSIEHAKTNVRRHYDLSNDLFAQFLDPTMSYSSAWFADADQDLESAQIRKIDAVLDYAGVSAGTRVLEIGSGWGALAARASRRGAKVTTITISREQATLASARFNEEQLDVDLQLLDYREVRGQYDAIVSVEMIEAVGEEYWPIYFATIDRHLAPGGKACIQAITMGHDRYLATRHSYGWIQKYIFPGGLIPSLRAIESSLADNTTLRILNQRSLGDHYARTLRQWRANFTAHWPAINAQGFDETFRRMWEFYLAYCEAGFVTGYLDVHQLCIARPAEMGVR